MSSQESPDSPPGSNSKNAMFEPKPKPKMIRVLTVLAYVLSVSMAAILLSIYYIFMWDGRPHVGARRSDVEMMEPHNYSEGRSIPMFSKYISHEDNLYNNLPKLGLPTTAVRVDNETSGNFEEEINITMSQHQDNTTDVRENQDEEKLQQQITAIESEEMTVSSTIPTTSEEISVTWPDDYDEFEKPGIFFKKMTGRYDY